MKLISKRACVDLCVLFGCVAANFVVTKLIGIEGCHFREILGFPCPGCGCTRAAIHLAKLDFYGAFQYNPSIYVIALSAILYIFLDNKVKHIREILAMTIVAAIAIIWVIRLIFGFPSCV